MHDRSEAVDPDRHTHQGVNCGRSSWRGICGLLLWWARGTVAMALLLCLHLGAVMALFATLPYGKFAHGVFRSAALLRYAVEKRQPNPIGLGSE